MAINNSYDEAEVVQAIAKALETFYGTLIEKIDTLDIKKVIKRKNPYLYRAKAMESASEIVESVLSAFVTSSEETIFGNCFFEPIAIAVSGGNKALAEGIDLMIQDDDSNTIYAIAVKSGPLYLMPIAKNARNRILWQQQNWHSRQRQDMRLISGTVTVRKRIVAEGSRRCIRN